MLVALVVNDVIKCQVQWARKAMNVKQSRKIRSIVGFAILLMLCFPQLSLAQADDGYFSETGHRIDDRFLEYFEENGGLAIFGYPITESFIDQGLLVQYFQKARLEWHPNNPDPYKIQLGLLGDELKYRRPPIPEPSPRSRRRVYFPQTGHTVAYTFLDFFKENGQVDIFGYPISEMYFEDGKVVQYFQRLKLEWSPEDPTSMIYVGNLGELYLSIYRSRIPSEALRPLEARPETGTFQQVRSLRAVISLRYSVMSQKSSQIVSVLVTDNNDDPIQDATVDIHLETPTGDILPNSQQSSRTDDRGFVQASIPVNEGKTGTQVIVQARVSYNELETTAQNVFLLWW